METFYGLRWYLVIMHNVELLWWGVLAGGGACLWGLYRRRRRLLVRRSCRAVNAPGGLRDYVAPLGCLVLGGTLILMPGWRALDGVLNEADIALLGCFFQERQALLPQVALLSTEPRRSLQVATGVHPQDVPGMAESEAQVTRPGCRHPMKEGRGTPTTFCER